MHKYTTPSVHREHIHPLISAQLPEFVRVDHPTLVAFLAAYYEWMDMSEDNLYSPLKLGSIIDVDKTLDQFLTHFKNEYLLNFPKTLAVSADTKMPVDEKKLIKNIKSFYAAKGTEKTYEFLFRILYDTNVQFYYPKQDILKLSDGKWIAKKTIKTSNTQGNFVYGASGKNIIQRDSSENVVASARVVDVTTYQAGTNTVTEFNLSGVNGTFTTLYGVEFTDTSGNIRKEPRVFSTISSVSIVTPGTNYKIGDDVVFTTASGDSGVNASGTVQEVDLTTGAVKKIRIDNFGVNYKIAPSVKINSLDGSGFTGTVTVGAVAQYEGYYANNDSRLSTNKVLQDNHYYQNFSYVLLSEITIDRYRDTLKRLLHPAGMGVFGSVLIKRCNYENIDKASSLIKYEVPLIGNYAPYTNNTFDDLSTWFTGTTGEVYGYVPRIHDNQIIGSLGNPLSAGITYFKDRTPGGVTAWGASGYNSSGNFNSGSTPLLYQVSDTPKVNNDYKQISAGWYHSLALDKNGGVTSWGYSSANSSWAKFASGTTGIQGVAAGLYLDAAILSDGSLTYGGSALNVVLPNGQIVSTNGYWSGSNGAGAIANPVSNPNFPTGVTGFKQVVVARDHGYGLKKDGTLAYFGITSGTYVIGKNLVQWSNDYNDSLANHALYYPAAVSSGAGWKSLTANGSFSNSITGATSGTGQASGTTGATLLTFGIGNTASTSSYSFLTYAFPNPSQTTSFGGISVYPNRQYTSSVWVKGASGSSGQTLLLRGVQNSQYSWLKLNENWQRITTTDTAQSTLTYPRQTIAIGTRGGSASDLGLYTSTGFSSCGLTTQVYVWGFQVEEGATATSYTTTKEFGATANYRGQDQNPTGVTFTQIDSIHWTTVGLMSNGGITAWGYLDASMKQIPQGTDYKQVAAGQYHFLALKNDGSLTAWGNNYSNVLSVPVGPKFTYVSCGYRNASAIDVDGNLYQWGDGVTSMGTWTTPYNYGQSKVPEGKWKFKTVDSGVAHSVGILDAQELRSTDSGLSAADPFWIIYQHPNKRIKDKTIARITNNMRNEFLGSYNLLSSTEVLDKAVAGVFYTSSTLKPKPNIQTPPDTIYPNLSAKVYSLIPGGPGGGNIYKFFRYVNNKTYVLSVYAKQPTLQTEQAIGYDTCYLYAQYQTGVISARWSLNTPQITPLQTANDPHATLGSVFNNIKYSKRNVGDGWWQLTITFDWIGPTISAGTPPLVGLGAGAGAPDESRDKGIYIAGWQLNENDLKQYAGNYAGSTGGVGGYWNEWSMGETAQRDEWALGFSGNAESKYAILSYGNDTQFRKITARAFFNIPVGDQFNCNYSDTSPPKPIPSVATLNRKQEPYETLGDSVTGGSSLTVGCQVQNSDNIPYYNIVYLAAELYWIDYTETIQKLLIKKTKIYPTTQIFNLSPPFTGMITPTGMFSNYQNNLGLVTFNDGTPGGNQITANGKYRLDLYFTDINGIKITGTESSTKFIYLYQ